MANNTNWLNISQMTGGTGETALSLTALTNDSLSAKTATIVAKNSQYNVSGTSTVTIQGFQPTLTLSRSTLRFDSTGGTATFTVYSNTAWTINFPDLVYSYSTSAGTGDTEVTVVLAPNPEDISKVEVGTVQDVFNVNQLYLTIVQESFIAELSVEPDDDIIFDNTGSSSSVTITSNTDWEIECPSWVVPSVRTGASGSTTVTFTAGENGPTDRSGQITVYAGSKEVTINVFQPFYIEPYITVTPSAWTFNYTEDGKTFIVDSYPEWTGEIVSTGESVWASSVYMEATFEIPSALTMPLYSSARSLSQVYVGPIRQYGSSITFESGGTYKVRYELRTSSSTTVTIPQITGNTYLTDIYLTDGVEAIPDNAFCGCTSLTGIVSDSVVAPTTYYGPFGGVGVGGTLVYPAGSDYSTWLRTTGGFLGYYFWNGLEPSKIYKVFTITYKVTSTTEPTQIARYDGQFSFAKDSNGKMTTTVGTGYTFPETGLQTLELYGTDYSYNLNINSIYGIQVNDIQRNTTYAIEINGELEFLTCCRDVYFSGNNALGKAKKIKVLNISGRATHYPTISGGTPQVFYGATGLQEVHITSTAITSIGGPDYLTLYNCPNLTAVTFYEGMTSVAGIRSCTALSSITLPSTVTTIDQDAFSGDTSLLSITSLSTTAPTLRTDSFRGVASGGTLYYPTGSDYSSWLQTGNYYLGEYGWTGQEI